MYNGNIRKRKEILEATMTTNFPKLNNRSRKLGEHQTGKQTKNTPTPGYFKFKLQKTKNKGRIWKESFTYRRGKMRPTTSSQKPCGPKDRISPWRRN